MEIPKRCMRQFEVENDDLKNPVDEKYIGN